MVTKNAAVEAIVKEALTSLELRAKSNKLQAGDTQLMESLWRCSFTSHTKYDRAAVTQISEIINYGSTPPKIHKDDDAEQYEFVVTNSSKWIAKWNINPTVTDRLEKEAAKVKADELAKKEAEKQAKVKAKEKEAADAAAKETAEKEAAENTEKAQKEVTAKAKTA